MAKRIRCTEYALLCILCLITVSFSSILAQKRVSFNTTVPTVTDSRYEIQIIVPGSFFHGVNGITFDSKDNLYAGSVGGQSIYQVYTNTGEVKEFIGPPLGMADDLEFGPDGRIYYTSFLLGKLHRTSADGKVIALAEKLPGINSLAFNKEGRLFAAQVYMGDALYEIDLTGEKKTRKIIDKLGGLNGFDFGPDNKLYGPLVYKEAIGRIDVETGKIEIVAEGFNGIVAVNFDSKGTLYAVELTGRVLQIDLNSGEKKQIAQTKPGIDNLAFDSQDRLFISIAHKNGIYEIDKKTGEAQTVVEGKLAGASGVAVANGMDGDIVYLVDSYALKKVSQTGNLSTLKKGLICISISVSDQNLILTKWDFTGSGSVQVIDRKTNEIVKIFKGFRAPSHALMMDDGSLVVTEIASGNILRVSGADGINCTVLAEGLRAPVCLAKAGNDAAFVTEVIPGTVARINFKTGAKKIIASGLKNPEGVSMLPDGKLAVVETGKRRLVQIDPVSGAISPIAINLPVGFPAIPGLPDMSISGVAVSNSGTIYVTGDLENVLYKLVPK